MPAFQDAPRASATGNADAHEAGEPAEGLENPEDDSRALEDAICSVFRGGVRKGVGLLVSLHGNSGATSSMPVLGLKSPRVRVPLHSALNPSCRAAGILTHIAAIPDADSAALSTATFFPPLTSGDAVEVAILPEQMFLSSARLGYVFVSCETAPGLQPLQLRRGKDCGVRLGERLTLRMKGEAGTLHVAETRCAQRTPQHRARELRAPNPSRARPPPGAAHVRTPRTAHRAP